MFIVKISFLLFFNGYVCSQENEFIEKIVKIFYHLCFCTVCEQFALCLVVIVVLQKRVDIAAFIYIILNLSLISFKACLFYDNLLLYLVFPTMPFMSGGG